MNFINDLCESNILRSKKHFERYSARDLADMLFLYTMALLIMKHEFDTAGFASDYARKTLQGNLMDQWRFSFTDLGAIIYGLFGKESDTSLFRDQKSSKLLLKRISFDKTVYRQWLKLNIQYANDDRPRDNRLLLNLEKSLKIEDSNYRSLRRLIIRWPELNNQERSIAMTRLLQYFRRKALRSEILPIITILARNKNYLVNAENPEETPYEQSALERALKNGYLTIGAAGLRLSETISAGCIAAIPSPVFPKKVVSRKKRPSPY